MDDFRTIVVIFLLTVGAFFMLVSAIGVIRMPDLFLRMSASTKSSTIGVACMLLAAGAYFFDDLGSSARVIATIVFMFITAPVAAHMIGRSSYFMGVDLWEGTVADELEGKYQKDTESLIGNRSTQELAQARSDSNTNYDFSGKE